MIKLPEVIWRLISSFMRPEDYYMVIYSSRDLGECLGPFRKDVMRNDAPHVGDFVVLNAQSVGRILSRRTDSFVIQHLETKKTLLRGIETVRRVRIFPCEISLKTEIQPYVSRKVTRDAQGKRVSTEDIWYSTMIRCPTCYEQHMHGMGTGPRYGHCRFYGKSRAFVCRYWLSYSDVDVHQACETLCGRRCDAVRISFGI